MAKYYGEIGYSVTEETKPGVYMNKNVERPCRGDIVKRSTKWANSEGVNDDLNLTMELSFIEDPYACQHFSEIKYVNYMGSKWKVTNIQYERPRLTLTIGGLYNG